MFLILLEVVKIVVGLLIMLENIDGFVLVNGENSNEVIILIVDYEEICEF